MTETYELAVTAGELEVLIDGVHYCINEYWDKSAGYRTAEILMQRLLEIQGRK